MFKNLLLFILIIIIDCKYNSNNYHNKETFSTPLPTVLFDSNGYKNGIMTFDFLKDENTNNVLNKYYMDNDKRINGKTINYNPYRYALPNIPVEGAPPYIYGIVLNHYQRKPKVWHKYDTYAQDIYNAYGIRR